MNFTQEVGPVILRCGPSCFHFGSKRGGPLQGFQENLVTPFQLPFGGLQTCPGQLTPGGKRKSSLIPEKLVCGMGDLEWRSNFGFQESLDKKGKVTAERSGVWFLCVVVWLLFSLHQELANAQI